MAARPMKADHETIWLRKTIARMSLAVERKVTVSYFATGQVM